MMQNQQNLNIIGQLEDLLHRVDVTRDPFLYYLPDLLQVPEFANITPDQALKFAQYAVRYDKNPYLTDALKILNQLVFPEDGSIRTPSLDMFYDNRTFFWKELGDHKSTVDVILHIFNKTLFELSVGER